MAKSKKIFRVSSEYPTNFGYEKAGIKLFSTRSKARKYALTLVKDLRETAKESDDDENVQIEDISKSDIVEAWRAEDGKVVHYPKGW